jgi:transcriptional regulator with XRE-family HTH domain
MFTYLFALQLGVLLNQARLEAGLTQEQMAIKLRTKKSAISRIENHAEDIRLSTLANYAQAVGKHLHLEVSKRVAKRLT